MAKDGKQPSVASFFSPPRGSAVASPSKTAATQSRNDGSATRKRKTGKHARAGAGAGGTELEAGQESPAKKKRVVEVLVLSDSDDPSSTSESALATPAKPQRRVKPDIKPTPPSTTPSNALAFFPGLRAGGLSASATSPSRPRATKSLDTSIFSFEPTRDVDTTSWPKRRVPFAVLVEAFAQISGTKSRLVILRVLVNLLRVVIEHDPESLLAVVYLTTNKLGPAHERDLDLGIGPMVLNAAIKDVCGITPAALRSLMHKHGDPGDVAFEASKSVRVLMRPAPLVCHSLFATFHKLAHLKGTGSIAVKTGEVKKLLVAAQGEEVRFLVRALIQNLRIGAVKLTLTTALARAFCLSKPPTGRFEGLPDAYFVRAGDRGRVAEVDERKISGKAKGKEREDFDIKDVGKRILKAELLLRKTWATHPDYGHLVAELLSGGLDDIDSRVPLMIGTPLQPMLGSPTRSLAEVYDRLSSRPFVSEAKLDGQRAQIHLSLEAPLGDGGRGQWYDPGAGNGPRIWVRIFSKHLEDQTDKYPDLLPTLHALVMRESSPASPMTSFIVDAEIAAIDPITSDVRTFQELSHRSKKAVELGAVKIRVGVFVFDLMYLNEESLLAEPFRVRRELLHRHFGCLQPADVRSAKWDLVPSCEENDPEEVKIFFRQCLEMKAEGIMVKLLDEAELDSTEDEDEDGDALSLKSKTKGRRKTLASTYEPDKRGDSWLKVKKDYMDTVGDSLDLIPIGAWHGNGRKAAWWSPILLGCVDEENGTITAVSKCMSGFTDEFYRALHARYPTGGDRTSTKAYPGVDAGGLRPHIWFEPSEVWEIKAADFTLSPVYPAAQGLISERGISLRFPRFLKIREDKTPEEATTSQQLADMYESQGQHRGSAPNAEDAAGDVVEEVDSDG